MKLMLWRHANRLKAICDRVCENQPSEHKKLPIFHLCFINYLCKMSPTGVEFNGLSSAICRNAIVQSQLEILAKI